MVLRVSRICAVPPASRTACTTRAVAVATPESRPRKFSAVRSAVRMLRAEPSTASTDVAGLAPHPRAAVSASTCSSGSTRSNTAIATGMPEITPYSFWRILASARAPTSTVASVVASPSPTSSASARSISSSVSGSMGAERVGGAPSNFGAG